MVDGIKDYSGYYLNNENRLKGLQIDGEKDEKLTQAEIRAKKRSGEMECQTCKSRKYVDGSDDPGVSFKTPQHINPGQSASVVTGHELEHYNRETAGAESENKEVVSANITLSRAVCSECGRSYVSGGQTHITKRVDADKNADRAHFSSKFYNDTVGKHMAKNIDKKI